MKVKFLIKQCDGHSIPGSYFIGPFLDSRNHSYSNTYIFLRLFGPGFQFIEPKIYRRVCTSVSIRSEAASIMFALHGSFTGSIHIIMVGGLKWIQVDSMNVVGGVGSRCIYFAILHKLCS